MDPPSLFRIPSSTNRFPDIWPLDSCNLLGIQPKKGHLACNLGFSEPMAAGFARSTSAAEESTVTEQSGGGRGGRKRRDVVSALEDERSKLASTSSGNEMIIALLNLDPLEW